MADSVSNTFLHMARPRCAYQLLGGRVGPAAPASFFAEVSPLHVIANVPPERTNKN